MELEINGMSRAKASRQTMKCSVVILTFNSAATVEHTVKAAQSVSDDIYVVDSYSTDGTVDVVRRMGAEVVQHEFKNYAVQRNWAIDNLPLRHRWQLHLDADEYLSEALINEMKGLDESPADGISGYYIPRRVRFLGRTIRHGGMYPIWHLRLFVGDKGRCEDREYDQHFYIEGEAGKLRNCMVDDQQMTLSEWTARHNRWSDAEARQIIDASGSSIIQGKWSGSPVQRKRRLRGLYYRAPAFVRAFGLFFYRYILRRGFLDGKAGLVFFVLQTFWFRFLVDAKLYEEELAGAKADEALGYKEEKRARISN